MLEVDFDSTTELGCSLFIDSLYGHRCLHYYSSSFFSVLGMMSFLMWHEFLSAGSAGTKVGTRNNDNEYGMNHNEYAYR